MIQYLNQHEIHRQKWETCILSSKTPVIYAQSWYLDIAASYWGALVLNDYEAVMVLPWKRKYGIRYIYQPFFTQQLGIFSSEEITDTLKLKFLEAIPSVFKKVHIALNFPLPMRSAHYGFVSRSNHILSTDKVYDDIYARYARRGKRNLKTANSYNLTIKEEDNIAENRKFIGKYLGSQVTDYNDKVGKELEKLMHETVQRKCGKILSLYRNSTEKIAVIFYAYNQKRCSMLACASTPEGYECQPMYFLIDHIIQTFAGTGITIDFFGSSVHNIAYFNLSFGTDVQTYHIVHSKNVWKSLLVGRR